MSKPPSTKGKSLIKINTFTQGVLIKNMLEGTYSCRELAELTGLHYATVQQYTRELHRAGAAHISSWEKDSLNRDVIKIYKIGVGKDAKRQRLTDVQRQGRAREKRRGMELAQVMAGTARYVQSGNGRLRFEAVP